MIFVRDVPTKMSRVNRVVEFAVFRAYPKIGIDTVCRMDKAVLARTNVINQTGTYGVVIRLEPFKNYRAGFSLYMNTMGEAPVSSVRRVFDNWQINQVPNFGVEIRRFKHAGVRANQAVNSFRGLRDKHRFFGQTGGESLVRL